MNINLNNRLPNENSSSAFLLQAITNEHVKQSSFKNSVFVQQNSVNMFRPLTDLQFFRFAQKNYPCFIQIEIEQMKKKRPQKQLSQKSIRHQEESIRHQKKSIRNQEESIKNQEESIKQQKESDEILQSSKSKKIQQHFPPMSPGKNSSIRPKPGGSKASKDQSMNSLAMDLHNLDLMPKNSSNQNEKSSNYQKESPALNQINNRNEFEKQNLCRIRPSKQIQLYLKFDNNDKSLPIIWRNGKRRWDFNYYLKNKNGGNQKKKN